MKTFKLCYLAIVLSTPLLCQCVIDETGNIPGTQNQAGQAGGSQSLSATPGTGTVTIREGGRVISVIRTASPNIEKTRWHKNQQQITVKSRGNHGPATVQLFDSRSGRLEGTVMAYELTNGGPKWANGMAD